MAYLGTHDGSPITPKGGIMYSFWAITFAQTGKRAVMRHEVTSNGRPQVALLRGDGSWHVVSEIADFTAVPITYLSTQA
jgi:hypothetical protein